MKPIIKVSKTSSAAGLNTALKRIAAQEVYVGIPQSAASRPGEPINNATLLYLHTNGSPLNNIPARPVIEPAIAASGNREMIAGVLGEAAKNVLDGRPDDAHTSLEKAGTLGANAAKRWFTDPRNGWAPNSPATIARKGSDRPLIDTGELRRSLTHVVKDDGQIQEDRSSHEDS